MQKNSFQFINASHAKKLNFDFSNIETENLFFNNLTINNSINFHFNLKRVFIYAFKIPSMLKKCMHKRI